MKYRYGSHTVYPIEYHLVWVTKYRYQVLRGEVAERVRELVRQTCEAFDDGKNLGTTIVSILTRPMN